MKRIIAPLLLFTLACAAQAAIITVNDVTDGSVPGACTLRDAVLAVNNQSAVNDCAAGNGANDTIEFDSTVFSPATTTTIPVAANDAHIEITKNLTINGPVDTSGNPLLTLDASPNGIDPGNNRIFYVSSGDSLTITGVAFRNGNAGSDYGDNGGAIYVDNSLSSHTLTLEQCLFVDNQAYSGGAVFAIIATIRNCTFNDNEATGNIGSGGAVYASVATIRSNSFEGNKAAFGGAVGTSDGIIYDSTFKDNGASYNGGAVSADYGTVTIDNSTFENNETIFLGGAVYAYYPSAISNSTFEDNEAGANGGAVYTNLPVTISNSTFKDNVARGNGGAVFAQTLDARHLTLIGNTAPDGFAQALYALDTVTLHNSIIIGSNNNDQCAISPYGSGNFTGNYNLEGWAASPTNSITDTTTCGTSNPVSANGASRNDIFATTSPDNNGGPTKTLALRPSNGPVINPAIGKADPSPGGTSQMWDFDKDKWTDATLDQRGYSRSALALGRDLGAYEDRRTPPPSASGGTPIPALPAPLLLLLAAAAGLTGRRHLLQRRR